MSWQVLSLVEALGVLRASYAALGLERERERREYAQKIAAAEDALARHEAEERDRLDEIRRLVLETERLQGDLVVALRERDEARRVFPIPGAGKAASEARRSS